MLDLQEENVHKEGSPEKKVVYDTRYPTHARA